MEKSVFTSEYRILCKLLREKRLAAKLTQIDLAQLLKETQSFVSKVERGDLRIDVVQLRQFCKAFEVPFVQFIKEFDSLTTRPKR